MKRDLYKKLLAWKNATHRKPLLLRGARQVGKTFLLKLFGKQEYHNVVYLNFETNPKLKDFFLGNLHPKTLIENISAYMEQTIEPTITLIIFDEVQESPEALNSLKYFQEIAPELHIVAAGSLLGVKLAHTKGFPVGKVNFLDLYPLTFFEFLDAIEKPLLREWLEKIKANEPIPEPIHEELIILLKRYLFIGGMPEAVFEFSQTRNLLSIREIHKAILDAYALDFAKHAPPEQVMRISHIWDAIPTQLAKENKKFIFSALKPSARAREYEVAIQWLIEAGLIYKSYQIEKPQLPLEAYADKTIFKLFLLDVGLLSAMSHIPAKSVVEKENLFSEFHGAFTENFVAQALKAQQCSLYYWSSCGTAEVDFILQHDLNVYPLEVKAGFSRKKKSLLVYQEKYHPEHLLRSSLMNLKKDGTILNLPLYLIDALNTHITTLL